MLQHLENKIDNLQKDLNYQSDHIDQIWRSMVWLISFAKGTQPRLDQLESYADLIPGYQATIADLKEENAHLQERKNNTAQLYGTILTINDRANPPVVMIQNHRGDEFECHIPVRLFEQAGLSIGIQIEVNARPFSHTIRGRGKYTVFMVQQIRIANDREVDQNATVV